MDRPMNGPGRFSIVAGNPGNIIASSGDGGGPTDGTDLDERVAKLELLTQKTGERFGTVERDLAVIASNYATRADVSDAKTTIILWVVGAVVAWGSTVVGVAMFVARHP